MSADSGLVVELSNASVLWLSPLRLWVTAGKLVHHLWYLWVAGANSAVAGAAELVF